MTAQQVIYLALRKIGALRPNAQIGSGGTINGDVLADLLLEWTNFFDECGAERNTNYSQPYFQYTITGPGSLTNGNGYLVGPVFVTSVVTTNGSADIVPFNGDGNRLTVGEKVSGTGIQAGSTVAAITDALHVTLSLPCTATSSPTIDMTATPDFVGPRPASISRANLVILNSASYPIYIPMSPLSQSEWSALSVQAIPPVDIATSFWYDPQYPNGVLNVFPPLSGNAVQIYQWGLLTPPIGYLSPFSMPPGYADFVIYGLAARFYPMAIGLRLVTNPISYQQILGLAYEARQKVEMLNREIPRAANDYPSSRGVDGGNFDRDVSYTGEPY